MGFAFLDAPASDDIEGFLSAFTHIYAAADTNVLFWFSDIGRAEVLELYKCRNQILGALPTKHLVLVLDTPGGDIDAAFMLVQVLRQSCEHLKIVVPAWAKSAGTLVCLAADCLTMSPVAELGPLDPQIYVPGDSSRKSALDAYQALETIKGDSLRFLAGVTDMLFKTTGIKKPDILPHSIQFVSSLFQPLTAQISPENLGNTRRTLDISADYGRRILHRYNPNFGNRVLIDRVVNQLVLRYPAHSFAIDAIEAGELGLPIEPPNEGELRMFDEFLQKLHPYDYKIIGSVDANPPEDIHAGTVPDRQDCANISNDEGEKVQSEPKEAEQGDLHINTKAGSEEAQGTQGGAAQSTRPPHEPG